MKDNENIEIINHEPDKFLLGNNEFSTVLVTVGAGATVTDGAILARSGEKFVIATDITGKGFAVMVGTLTNNGASATDYSCRVCIAGSINAAKVTVGGEIATAEQLDAIRDYGFIPVKINKIGKLDNQ